MDPLDLNTDDMVKLEALSDFCQCCLSENNLVTMSPDDRNEIEYIELLSNCFSIKLIDNDLFESPYFICESCEQKLTDCYMFRCQIEDSQAKLKDTYSKNSVLSISPLPDVFSRDDDETVKAEYLSEETMESDLINDDISNDDNILTKKDKDKKINKKPFKIIIKVKKDTKINTKNDYSTTVENIIKKDKPQKNRNNIKALTKADLLRYKRVYNRNRYAKSLPFKLKQSSLTCDICNETFSTHRGLVSHMSTHFPNHVCYLCGKSFVLKNHLSCHMNTHKLEKESCPTCGKILKKSSITRHMKIHNGDTDIYACPHCPERFVSFSNRINHMAECHNVDIYRYNCKICAKKFRLSSSLSKHVRRCHFQELNCNCEECGKGFFDKKSLKEHMLKHTGEKKFKCDICSKTYGRKSTIKEHMKIHNNEKVHICTVCNKAFVQKCSLKLHLRMHTNSHKIYDEM